MFDILYNIKYMYSLACWPSFFTNTRYRLFTRIPDADAAILVHAELLSSVECIAKETSSRIIKMRADWSSRFIYETLAGLIYIAIFYWHIDRLYIYIYRINYAIHSVFVIERLSKVCEMSYHNHSLSKKFPFSLEIRIYICSENQDIKFFEQIKRKKIETQ